MTPSPADIRAARIVSGLTQTQAAALVHCACRSWQQWEAGSRVMSAGLWELWQLKTGGLLVRAVSLVAQRRKRGLCD